MTSTFAQVIEALYRNKHTGPVIIHFAQGHPNSVELPKEPERIRLDKGVKVG